MSSKVLQLTDKASHDALIAESKTTPTVIHVSNSVLPICKNFNPKYERLASEWSAMGIRFAQLEFTDKTSMMFKFSPNQLPVTVFMVHDNWCKTVMSDDLPGIEAALGLLLKEAKKGGDGRTDSPMRS